MKKIISIILCCVMLASTLAFATSAEDATPVKVEAFKVNATAVTVDGKIDAIWSEANSYAVDYVRFNYTEADLKNLPEVQVKLLWDGVDMLYVLAVIKDSTNYTASSSKWENDSIETWIRINGTTRSFRVGRNGVISGWDSSGAPRWPWKEFAKTDTADGFIVEYKIQLNFTEVSGGTKPMDDKDVYIDFVYNDATEAKGGRQALLGFLENKNEGSGNANESSLAVCTLSDTLKGSVLPPEETTTEAATTEPVTTAPDTTVADTTVADTTVADTTAADTTTTAPADKEESGCGSTIGISGVAVIAAVAMVAGAVTRKKKD